MSVSWNKDLDSTGIIAKIDEIKKIQDDGNVVFESLQIIEYQMLLKSMLIFPAEIPEIDTKELVIKAIRNSARKNKLTQKNLLSEVNRLEKDYQSLPIRKFVLVSSISIDQFIKLNKIIYEDKTIIFEKTLPHNFRIETEELEEAATRLLFADLPTNYINLRIFVSARTIHDAANQALDTIDLIRGIWNMIINRQQVFWIPIGGKVKPINRIILGPLHTLHNPDGSLPIINNWWFEPNYLGSISPYKPSNEEILIIYKSLYKTRKKLQNHKYSKDLKNAIIRYTRALDERDYRTAFHKLWSIAELLTNAIGNYDVMKRRIAFMYQDRDYHIQVLELLRRFRNLSIHNDKENSEIEMCLYQIKNYVESLLAFHITNRFGFPTLIEASTFLDLPYDERILNEKISGLQFSKKYHGY